jgi:hypothetical protein
MLARRFTMVCLLRQLIRAAAIMLVLWTPLLAVQSVRADAGSTIEAPAPQKKGMGLVLLVSLQRA